MVAIPKESRFILPEHGDPVRGAPLHRPEEGSVDITTISMDRSETSAPGKPRKSVIISLQGAEKENTYGYCVISST